MRATAQLRLEEFLKLPRKPGKQELLDGELIELPPAKRKHGQIVKRVQHWLEGLLPESRVWVEMGYQLEDKWLQPDVSVTWPDQPVEDDWFQGAPMIAVEVISPASEAEQIDRKVSAYLHHGAAEVWVVYARTRSIVVFARDGKAHRAAGSYHSELLQADIDIDALLE